MYEKSVKRHISRVVKINHTKKVGEGTSKAFEALKSERRNVDGKPSKGKLRGGDSYGLKATGPQIENDTATLQKLGNGKFNSKEQGPFKSHDGV